MLDALCVALALQGPAPAAAADVVVLEGRPAAGLAWRLHLPAAASAEPTTLVIVRIGQPLRRAALTAPMVSAVSPDCDTATTSVSGPTTASR